MRLFCIAIVFFACVCAEATVEKIYLCSKCSMLVYSVHGMPSISGCPAGNYHKWNMIGYNGDRYFYCNLCNISVHAKQRPPISGCPAGSYHKWTEMPGKTIPGQR